MVIATRWLKTTHRYEAKRMLLVRALINRPKLLFLDEPTSGLIQPLVNEFVAGTKNAGNNYFSDDP